MIVDRNEFKKFWKKKFFIPNIIFCNDTYYIPSLKEIEIDLLPKYKQYLINENIIRKESWDCSKFAILFKTFFDFHYSKINNYGHVAIAIAHIKLKKQKYDHALNFLIYKNENNVLNYIFFDPENVIFLKNEILFKNLEFLYF
jgi:hypothetical protein